MIDKIVFRFEIMSEYTCTVGHLVSVSQLSLVQILRLPCWVRLVFTRMIEEIGERAAEQLPAPCVALGDLADSVLLSNVYAHCKRLEER